MTQEEKKGRMKRERKENKCHQDTADTLHCRCLPYTSTNSIVVENALIVNP